MTTAQKPASVPAKPEDPVKTLRAYIDARRSALADVMAKGMDLDRCTRIALANVAKTPGLLKVTPASIYQAIHQSLQLGLEPGGPLGHAYLVPFKGECVLVIGYKGLVVLARRSGEISMVEARVARAGESFEVDLGTSPSIVHRPKLDGAAGQPIAYYCVITYRDGAKQIDVMSAAEVEAIHQRSASKDASFSPWKSDYIEMGKKTVARRALKMAPLTVELAEQFNAEDEADRNAPVLRAIPDEEPAAPPQTRADAERRALAEAAEEHAEAATVEAEPERETVPANRKVATTPTPTPTSAAAPDEPDEYTLLVEQVESAATKAELNEAGTYIEKAKPRLSAEAHKALITLFQRRTNALNGTK